MPWAIFESRDTKIPCIIRSSVEGSVLELKGIPKKGPPCNLRIMLLPEFETRLGSRGLEVAGKMMRL